MVDIAGQYLMIGDRIACAFSYGSHGVELRLGRIVGFPLHKAEYGAPDGLCMIEVDWEKGARLYAPKRSRIRADVIKFAKIPEDETA